MISKKNKKTLPANVKQAAASPAGATTKAAKGPFDAPVATAATKIRYLQRTVGNQTTLKFLNLKRFKKAGRPARLESGFGFDISRSNGRNQRPGRRWHGSRLALQRVRWSEGEIPPMPPDEFRQWVIAETESLAADHSPPVPGATVRRYLDPATGPPGLIGTLAGVVRRSLGLRHAGQLQFATASAARLLRGVILAFILDPTASSLDLLPPAQRNRYRNFRWHANDYPGGPAGPNEARARQLARALSGLRPERRANAGPQAVVTRHEHTAPIERHIQANLRNIPAFPNAAGAANAPRQPAGHRLYERAQDAFVRMRAAAWRDGVPLIVLSSYRDPAVARARAAAAGNPAAVASFSAHSLGLAVDLQMSFRYQSAAGPQRRNFAETTTRPMQNVVDMRQSPAHKWMMLRGAEFGWFPYQNEPWHWEFNPPNFRQEFHQAAAAAQPAAGGGGRS